MKLSEGKYYKRLDGNVVGPAKLKARPLSKPSGLMGHWDEWGLPGLNQTDVSYYANGKHGCNRDSCFLNLVEEVDKPISPPPTEPAPVSSSLGV